MKRHIISVAPNLTAYQAARKMKAEQIGFLPVCTGENHVLGVITDRDIVLRVCAEGLDVRSTRVDRIMSRQPVSCQLDASLEEAEELMLRHHTRRILVVDQDDKLVGLITLADIAQCQSPLKTARWLRELSSRRLRLER